MGKFISAKKAGRRSRNRAKRRFFRLPKPIYVALALLIAFGSSAVAKAAQKVKKLARGTRDTLKDSVDALLSARAWAYFKPVWHMSSVSSDDLQASVAEQENLLEDPEKKIEKEFRVPKALRGRVLFWVNVYSRYSSSYRIVHDRDNPELIYGYIDFRVLYSSYSKHVADAKAYKIEKLILKELKERLAEAGGLQNTTLLTAEESISLKKLLADNDLNNPQKLQKAIGHLRTQTGQRDFFVKALQRSKRYLPQIEQLFREQGLPIALSRLPFVESSFNPGARSKDGAFGMWQLMPSTAKLFDRSGTRKEWGEPVRQSRSAARLLKLLQERLPNWGVAVTAYNSGAARLDRIVKKYRVSSIEDLIEVPASKETLGFAGKNFYCELLAANIVEAYQEKLFPPSMIQISGMAVSRKVQSLIEKIKVPKATSNNKINKTKITKAATRKPNKFENRSAKRQKERSVALAYSRALVKNSQRSRR